MPRGAPFKRKRRRNFRSTANKRTASGQLALMKRNQNMALTIIANARSGGFIGLENKFHDFSHNGSMSLTWSNEDPTTRLCISSVPQNDSATGRDGRVYHITSLFVRGYINELTLESQTGPIKESAVKLVMVLDKMTNKAQLTATDVMDNALQDDILAFRKMEFTSRFRVLKSQSWVVKQQQMNEGGINLFATPKTYMPIFNWAVKFNPPLKVTCTGVGGNIDSIIDNSIHIIGINPEATCKVQYHARIRYKG